MKRRVEIHALVESDNHVEPPAPGQRPQFYGVYAMNGFPDDDGHYSWVWKRDFTRRESAIKFARRLAKRINGDFDEIHF